MFGNLPVTRAAMDAVSAAVNEGRFLERRGSLSSRAMATPSRRAVRSYSRVSTPPTRTEPEEGS